MPQNVRSMTVRMVFAALALFATSGLVACTRDSGPEAALDAFLKGWSEGNLDGVALEGPDGTSLAPADVLTQIDGLAGDLEPRRFQASRAAELHVENDRTRAELNVEWTVADGLVWPYSTAVDLRKVDGSWHVVFTPAVVHPDLLAGDQLTAQAIPATRGSIMGESGVPIVGPRPVVNVGIQPSNVTDLDGLIAALGEAFDSLGLEIDLSDLPQRIAAADPNAFVPVVTLRREAYDQIRPQIYPLDGTVFTEDTLPLAPTREFARALLGTVGDVTREQLDTNPGKYLVGERIGQSGLQQQFDDLLRGTPGVEIRYLRGGSASPDPLFRAEPKSGGVLTTTLNQEVQSAADAALAGESRRSALVAVRVSDGAIVAVANGPGGGELNLAFDASVPPGSTFKMVSALGLLGSGAVTADTSVECPQSFTVDGRSFTNAGGFELGTVPFHTAFARSCNTAFAQLAPQLGADGLRQAATSLGIGTAWNLGIPVATGSVGANQSNVEAAAAAFGQGTTQVSPVVLAGATAAVARGTWVAPKLFPERPQGASEPSGDAPQPPADGTALPAAVSALQAMMREVVTDGTATALADVPGEPVAVKTGTAEFNDNPAETHAWTVGWQGDIAFAVFVEKGGGSGETAVPIVEAFLRGLA
jgi:cell division protein FtsI/penicillin-binding protein 2